MLADWGRGTKALVIVAHPDDEIIWCGGLLLRHRDWARTVLCLCRADDPDRRAKFEAVCDHLGLEGIQLDLDDSSPPAEIDLQRDLGGRIRQTVCDTPWDLCLTHGANGEYGHPRHRQVHQTVVRLMERGLLECDELWTFAYDCSPPPAGRCRPADGAEEFLDLSPEEWEEKKRIVRDWYGYPEDGFEVTACISPEAFRLQSYLSEE